MKRNKKRVIAAIAVIGLLAAGGAAFTTAIGAFPADNTNTAAFAQTEIQGATSAGVVYNLSTDGQYVQSADVYFTADQAANTVSAGFGTTTENAQVVTCQAQGPGSGTYSGDYKEHCVFSPTATWPSGVRVTNANYFVASVTDKTGDVTGVTPQS
jgi:hypothetical protein